MIQPTKQEIQPTKQEEDDFTRWAILGLAKIEGVPPREEVVRQVSKLAELYPYDGPLGPVITNVFQAVVTQMEIGASLVNPDPEAYHDQEWFHKGDYPPTYSKAYSEYLKTDQGLHARFVSSLDIVSEKILGHLQDPNSKGSWDRRGLVIGHVQSGKTSNYINVICKAADAGYKFIVVIAGLHNILRKQTQERIDEGFVGRSSDLEQQGKHIGVGTEKGYPSPVTLTTVNYDFNRKTARQSGWELNDFRKPIIIVIKKNVRTLESLFTWLSDMNAKGKDEIKDVPMLMIDDEADNASINTNKSELDPTKTNRDIRKILKLFRKSCYVGYTATPFANVFIDPDPDPDDKDGLDRLFPRDFMYCLDPPSTYFGPNEIFLDDVTSNRALEEITDCEYYLPVKHKIDHQIDELPESLCRALNQFVIVKAIRNLRGHVNKHCSMMINVSRFVRIQRSVYDLITTYMKELKEAVKANYALSNSYPDHNKFMQELEAVYSSDYKDCEFEWDSIKDNLFEVVKTYYHPYLVNNTSDQPLDYKKWEKDGHALTAIVVGGLSLSRGLTVEGLAVSYMFRNTRMYDTLMQMGRWFGFRPGYEDLCRVHLSKDSIDWYGHIAEVTNDLIELIKQMGREGVGPRDFGLYVKAHPDSLRITAYNKMRTAKKITVKQNLSGRLVESYILSDEEKMHKENEDLIKKFWENRFECTKPQLKKTEKGWIIEDVPINILKDFLDNFQVHAAFDENKRTTVKYLQEISSDYPEGDVLLISLDKNNSGQDEKNFCLGAQQRTVTVIPGKNFWRSRKERVASRGDEKLGLDQDQRKEAKNNASPRTPSDIHFRQIRKKPLLMIHILKLKNEDLPNYRIPAFGISFPPGHYNKEITVYANRVYNDLGSVDHLDQEEEDDE